MRKSYKEMLVEKNILLRNIDRLSFLECMEHKSRMLYSLTTGGSMPRGQSALVGAKDRSIVYH